MARTLSVEERLSRIEAALGHKWRWQDESFGQQLKGLKISVAGMRGTHRRMYHAMYASLVRRRRLDVTAQRECWRMQRMIRTWDGKIPMLRRIGAIARSLERTNARNGGGRVMLTLSRNQAAKFYNWLRHDFRGSRSSLRDGGTK